MTAPSIKDALEDLISLCERKLYPQPDKPNSDWARVQAARAALAALHPSGERREAIARIIDPEAFRPHESGFVLYGVECNDALAKADHILASGLLQDEAGWQPIETAPKDGTEIILFTHHEPNAFCEEAFDAVQIGWWDNGNHAPGSAFHRDAGWHLQKIGVATHWMPLPAPPIRSARDGGGDNVAHILRDAQAGKEVHRTL